MIRKNLKKPDTTRGIQTEVWPLLFATGLEATAILLSCLSHLPKPCSENTFCWQNRPWAAASDASRRHCHLKLAVTEQACRKLQERGMSARQKCASRVDFRHLEKRRRRSSPQAAFGAFAKQPRRRRTVCLGRSWAMGLGRRVPHVTIQGFFEKTGTIRLKHHRWKDHDLIC